jgi:hypothetical protein
LGRACIAYILALRLYKKRVSFYIHTDENIGMGIGILIPVAMISKSIIEKLASVDDKEILTVSDLVQETFEYLVKFQMAQRQPTEHPNMLRMQGSGARACVCVTPLFNLLLV